MSFLRQFFAKMPPKMKNERIEGGVGRRGGEWRIGAEEEGGGQRVADVCSAE